MAIDPRISLSVQQASILPAIDIFNRARQQQIENERQAMFDPLRAAQMQQGLEMGQQQLQQQQSLMQDQESIRDMNNIANFFDINQQDFQVGNEQFLKQKIIDSNLSDLNKREAIETIDSRGVEALSNQFGQVKNIVRPQVAGQQTPVAIQERESLLKDLESDNPDVVKSARIELGLDPKAQAFKAPKLSSATEKELITSQNAAVEAGNNVGRFELLASDFEKADVGGGLFQGKWAEALKEATGNQNAISELRRRYAAIKGGQVVKNLPPGAASDTDIALALAGFPTENATGEQIASFMRGLAKIEREQQRFNEFKASYISEKGNTRGMLGAWREEESKNIELPQTKASFEGFEILSIE